MKYPTFLSGLVLFASVLQGCASTNNIGEAVDAYKALKSEIKQYEPVGDEKIDALARPFVASAVQLKADVDKEAALISSSPLTKMLGQVAPENAGKAFAALPAEDRAVIEKALATSKSADDQRLYNLVKSVANLVPAGAKLTMDIKDIANGGSAGAIDILKSVVNGASEPGEKAISQVKRSIEFGPPAKEMIDYYRGICDAVAKSIVANVGKAQS